MCGASKMTRIIAWASIRFGITGEDVLRMRATPCFLIPMQGVEDTPEIGAELKHQVRKVIGPFATPDYIICTAALPKTRSGKVSFIAIVMTSFAPLRCPRRGLGR